MDDLVLSVNSFGRLFVILLKLFFEFVKQFSLDPIMRNDKILILIWRDFLIGEVITVIINSW